ncbi:hypothetical protein NS334_03890 [Sphingomonas endophytica]|uniref:Toxin n=1 Tax=Sphingomonas endophytica TaxID=869719 RepID=A0A147I7W9_9SPHN|nr:hypothetical protein NS334_03890 [Sphingomonas endophytica]
MGYRLSDEADEDYFSIYLHGVETFGEEQAERYADLLDRAFAFLGDHPRAGRERLELREAIRGYPTGSHLIFYAIDEDDDVLILRIRHGREDWAAD